MEATNDVIMRARTLLSTKGSPTALTLDVLVKSVSGQCQAVLCDYLHQHLPLYPTAWPNGKQAGEVRTLPRGLGPVVWCPGMDRGFWLWQTPVTKKQFRSILHSYPTLEPIDTTPATEMSFRGLEGFLIELSGAIGGYWILPTYDEWKHACLAGGDKFLYAKVDDIAWNSENCDDIQPVGQKLPNAWGLHDMIGNVWELLREGDYVGGSCFTNYFEYTEERIGNHLINPDPTFGFLPSGVIGFRPMMYGRE